MTKINLNKKYATKEFLSSNLDRYLLLLFIYIYFLLLFVYADLRLRILFTFFDFTKRVPSVYFNNKLSSHVTPQHKTR